MEYADLECPAAARPGRLPTRPRRPRARGRFWDVHDSLYEDQGHLDDPHLWARCEALGLDLERFEADRRSEASADRVERDFRSGIRAGVTTTPTLFVDRSAHPGVPGDELLSRLR
jgi:protein-disulfide isomerase